MKTVEELAKEIFMKAGLVKMSEMEGVVAALIRADREAVLNTLIENLAIQEFVSFRKGKEVVRGIKGDDISRVLAAVKKEVLL